MAYAERRGDYYRGRYKNPPGVSPKWGTVSEDDDNCPFTRKDAALVAAEDKAAEIRQLVAEWRKLTEGRTPPAVEGVLLEEWRRLLEGLRRKANGGRDPNAGDITLAGWLEKTWWPAQDLADRTVNRYRYSLRGQILPAFGHRPLNTLIHPQEIDAWERSLRETCSISTAAKARVLLSTILGDAKAAGLVDDNFAARRRGRGRRRGRVHRRGPKSSKKVWATPLDALLVAERCALLTGQEDDLVMWLTCAWCGLRWGELLGLQPDSHRGGKVFVEWQLGELDGRFAREDPKDDSFRNDSRDYFGALGLPPFLDALLTDYVERRPPRRCRCRQNACGGGRYLFLGPRGGHHTRSGYSRRAWHPAIDGAYPDEQGKRIRPDRPVLADVAVAWPGEPLRPAWPFAEGEEWRPPQGRGRPRFDRPVVRATAVDCPDCEATAGTRCVTRGGGAAEDHRGRVALAAASGHSRDLALVSWLPLKPGLTPHGLRHGHKVWLDEDRMPEILKHNRLGHAMPGIGGTYSHVSPSMRADLLTALQERWETALGQRAALSPHSPVPLLDELLAPLRETDRKIISRTSPDLRVGSLA